MNNARDTGRHTTSANTALFVTAAVIITVIASTIAIAAFIDDPETRIGLMALMLSQLPIVAGLLRVLVITDKVDEKTDRVLNGDMDAKIRAAAREAIVHTWGTPDEPKGPRP